MSDTETIPQEKDITPEEIETAREEYRRTGGVPVEEEEPDASKLRQRKPPREGPCRRCGKDKPLNRLMLCYRCWVITNLEDAAKKRGERWVPGVPHPETCHCDLPEHTGTSGRQNTRSN